MIAAILLCAGLTSCGGETSPADEGGAAATITIFAAASLTDVITEAASRFEDANEGVTIRTSFASSSTLAQQIDAGAPADLYISADVEWMDFLQERDRIDASSRVALLSNRLVLIAPADSTLRFDQSRPLAEQLGGGRLAIGDPTHVPVGRYAREALETLGWWEAVEPRSIAAVDVRAAVRLVEAGEATMGIVYASDATAASRVRVLWSFPEQSHTRIVYPAALLPGAPRAAAEFLEFMKSPEMRAVFEGAGFRVVAGD